MRVRATLTYATRPFLLKNPENVLGELSSPQNSCQQVHHLPLDFMVTNPEIKLMRAVLEDAILCYRKRWSSKEKNSQRLAREAEAWMFRDDLDWPLSFLNICTVLGIDPDYLRRGLRRWQQLPPAACARKQRSHGSRGRAVKIAA